MSTRCIDDSTEICHATDAMSIGYYPMVGNSYSKSHTIADYHSALMQMVS